MSACTNPRGRRGLRALLFLGLFAAGSVFVNGQAALGAKDNPSISTAGVVAFGDGTNSSSRGTYTMSPSGSGLGLLTTYIYPTDVSRGAGPITVLVNSTPGQDIWAIRADGTGTPVQVRTGSSQSPRFSLDGARIAYGTATVGSPSTFTISTADVVRNGSNEVTGLTNTQVVWSGTTQTRGLDFSRDGTRIVFSASTGGGNWDLFLLSLSSGSVTQLTNTSELEQYPRWSPTDDRIAYQALPNGGSGVGSLRTIDATTGVVKTVLSGTSKLYATMPCWSPDAANLLALVKQVDLYQFPSGGGSGVNVTGGTSLQPNVPCWGW